MYCLVTVSTRADGVIDFAADPDSDTNKQRTCMKYFFSGRRAFSKSMDIALATDYSRVSKRGCGLGVHHEYFEPRHVVPAPGY